MNLKLNDAWFLLIGVILAGLAAVAIGSPDANIALYGIAGVMGFVLLLAIILKPSFGANILIFAIFTNFSRQLADIGLPGVVIPLVLTVSVATLIRNYYAGQLPTDRKKTFAIEAFLILYFLAMVVSYLAATNKEQAIFKIMEMVKDIIIVYTIIFALRDILAWKQAIRVVVITTTLLCLLGTYQVVTGNYAQDFFGFARVSTQSVFDNDSGGTRRLAGPVNDPNMWAQIIVAVIPFVLFQIINEPDFKLKVFGAGMLGILSLVLLNTYSRGGYVGLMVVIFLALFVYGKKFNPVLIFLGLGLFVVMLPLLPAKYAARFDSLKIITPGGTGFNEDGSVQGRLSVMLSGIAMFADHPIIGVGVGNFQTNYQDYSGKIGIEFEYGERDPHSLVTQILAETGIFGMISFIGIIISLLSGLAKSVRSITDLPAYKSNTPWLMSLQVSIIGYLVAALFLHDAYIRYFWIIAALSITAIQLMDEHVKSYNSSNKPKFSQ